MLQEGLLVDTKKLYSKAINSEKNIDMAFTGASGKAWDELLKGLGED